jgi:hypothetical protein
MWHIRNAILVLGIVVPVVSFSVFTIWSRLGLNQAEGTLRDVSFYLFPLALFGSIGLALAALAWRKWAITVVAVAPDRVVLGGVARVFIDEFRHQEIPVAGGGTIRQSLRQPHDLTQPRDYRNLNFWLGISLVGLGILCFVLPFVGMQLDFVAKIGNPNVVAGVIVGVGLVFLADSLIRSTRKPPSVPLPPVDQGRTHTAREPADDGGIYTNDSPSPSRSEVPKGMDNRIEKGDPG